GKLLDGAYMLRPDGEHLEVCLGSFGEGVGHRDQLAGRYLDGDLPEARYAHMEGSIRTENGKHAGRYVFRPLPGPKQDVRIEQVPGQRTYSSHSGPSSSKSSAIQKCSSLNAPRSGFFSVKG